MFSRRRFFATPPLPALSIWNDSAIARRSDSTLKVDEIWRARNEASLFAHESTISNNHQGDGVGFGGALLGGSALRWGVVRHDPRASASAPGGGGGGGGIDLLREGGFGAAKGKAFRQFKEEQVSGKNKIQDAPLFLRKIIVRTNRALATGHYPVSKCAFCFAV